MHGRNDPCEVNPAARRGGHSTGNKIVRVVVIFVLLVVSVLVWTTLLLLEGFLGFASTIPLRVWVLRATCPLRALGSQPTSPFFRV